MKPSWLPLAELSSSPQRKETCKTMDSVEIASARGNKWRVNKKNRGWHKRLHLRKTADQPPTMQSEDKHGPKEIAEEWEHSTVWPSLKKPPHAVQQSQQRTSDSGNTLRFTCSLCGDSLEYVPKDLLRHFEDKHRGSPPVFSCHMCTFSTHEFSYLQVHLLSHKDTFSTCNLCNDNVQRTWPEFSEHLTMCHCQNGNYACEMCYKFSTGDVGVFLEHMYAHNLMLDGVNDDLHTKDRKKFGLKATTETLRCQHCGYEASRKLLINKDIKAIHICPKDKQKKMKTEVHSIAIKPNDPIPKIKPRLTRSAVREMCWLTQDCLSLPGKEFLDKYCTLSDPQTTLEETQQFLMKSVAGETGDQKWTKALKSVFSNVPQDINLQPMAENGIMSDSSDLTVLTVKNKITVAQNGTTYAKKMKMMNSPEKETVEIVSDEGRGVVNQNGCQLNLNDHASCPQTDTILNNDASLPAQGLRSECTQTEENRENQDVKTDQEIKDCGNKQEQPKHEDGINISNESQEPQCISKVVSKSKRRNQKRKARCKKADKRAAGLPLKIVLKKNPVKEKQWVSQSSLSPLGDGQRDENHGLPVLDITSDENMQIPHNMLVTKEYQGKRTKAPEIDLQNPSEGVTATPQTEPGIETGSCLVGLTSIEMQDDAEKTTQFLGTDVDVSASAGGTSQSDSSAEARSEEISSENVQLQTSGDGSGCHTSDYELSSAADGATSSPVPKPVITPPGKTNSEEVALPSDQSVERMRGGEVLADSGLGPLRNTNLPTVKAIQQEPSPASGQQWQLAPKNLERTLKLVAISPYQLVKRPAGDQPVVVLNHPDADIPEVARIMEVINRYRGEVQKVMLSRKTVNALSTMNGEALNGNDPKEAEPDLAGDHTNCVQERFLLKLKLRRLCRKKYEVVDSVSSSWDSPTKFRCWFCGRVFTNQEMWVIHRQRHLIEWK